MQISPKDLSRTENKARHTFKTVVFSRNSANALAASTPIVFPPRWISSTTVGSTALRWGSMSDLESNLRLFPWRENTFAAVDAIRKLNGAKSGR